MRAIIDLSSTHSVQTGTSIEDGRIAVCNRFEFAEPLSFPSHTVTLLGFHAHSNVAPFLPGIAVRVELDRAELQSSSSRPNFPSTQPRTIGLVCFTGDRPLIYSAPVSVVQTRPIHALHISLTFIHPPAAAAVDNASEEQLLDALRANPWLVVLSG